MPGRMGFNEYEIRGEVAVIFVESKKYGRKELLVDAAVLCRFLDLSHARITLAYDKRIDVFYAALYVGRRSSIAVHRFITDAPAGTCVDHIDHDGLNNRRSNLRVVSNAFNQLNRKRASSRSSTGILGVDFNKDTQKWRATVRIQKKAKCLGYFTSPESAESALVTYRKELGIPCQPQR